MWACLWVIRLAIQSGGCKFNICSFLIGSLSYLVPLYAHAKVVLTRVLGIVMDLHVADTLVHPVFHVQAQRKRLRLIARVKLEAEMVRGERVMAFL